MPNPHQAGAHTHGSAHTWMCPGKATQSHGRPQGDRQPDSCCAPQLCRAALGRKQTRDLKAYRPLQRRTVCPRQGQAHIPTSQGLIMGEGDHVAPGHGTMKTPERHLHPGLGSSPSTPAEPRRPSAPRCRKRFWRSLQGPRSPIHPPCSKWNCCRESRVPEAWEGSSSRQGAGDGDPWALASSPGLCKALPQGLSIHPNTVEGMGQGGRGCGAPGQSGHLQFQPPRARRWGPRTPCSPPFTHLPLRLPNSQGCRRVKSNR